MTSAPRLVTFGTAVFLLVSCAGSGTSGPQPATSTRPSASVPLSASSSTSPRTSSARTAASPTVSVKPVVLHIRGFAYVPAAPVAIVGQPIEIINDDVAAHTWSAAPAAGWAYTSGNLEKGQRATFPGFTKPGRYKFLCYYHAEMPLMNGVVTAMAAP